MKRLVFVIFVVVALAYWNKERIDINQVKNFAQSIVDEDSAKKLQRISNSRDRKVYRINENRWLHFDIDPAALRVKVISTASVALKLKDLEEDTSWSYSMEYQLLDNKGQVIREGEYFHRTGVVIWKNIKTGERESSAFYIDKDLIPCQSRNFILLQDPEQKFTAMKIRFKSRDEVLQDISVSCLSEFYTPSHRQRLVWHRIDSWKKDQLAKSNIYPAYLLREEEKLLLVSKQWKPMGPSGIPGRDWDLQIQYVRLNFDGLVRDTPSVPHGSIVSQGRRGVMVIPETGLDLQLKFKQLKSNTTHKKNYGINLQWTSRDGRKEESYHLNWKKGCVDFKKSFAEGHLEMISEGDFAFQAFDIGNDPKLDITPVHTRVRVFAIDHPDETIRYKVHHKDETATPFRLDFRCQDTRVEDQDVKIKLLNGENSTIDTLTLHCQWQRSEYDHLLGLNMNRVLSESVSYYFHWSSEVKGIEVSSEKPLLIGAYNRPEGIPREINLSIEDENDLNKQPMWFSILPINHTSLRVEGRSHVVHVPPRSKQIDQNVLDGQYYYEDFFPEGPWLGSHLLVPLEEGRVLRQQAVSQLYMQMNPNKKKSLLFKHPDDLAECRPKVIYQEVEPGAEVQILKDGFEWKKLKLKNARGVFSMTSVQVGEHEIEFKTEGKGLFFISHVMEPQASHIRKSVIKMKKGDYHFKVQKRTNESETIGLKLFSPKQSSQWVELKLEGAKTKKDQGLEEWNFNHKRYKINYSTDVAALPVSSRGQEYFASQAMNVRLGKELPKGEYTIQFITKHEEDMRLSLNRLIPGEFNRRRIYNNVRGVNVASLELKKDFQFESWLKARQHPNLFKSPNTFEVQKASALFQRVLRGDLGGSIQEQWKALGMEMILFEQGQEKLIVIGEIKGRFRGLGIYLIRLNKSQPVLLQCPHAFKDLYTGKISRKLFSELPFHALSLNTHQRYAHEHGEENPDMSDRRLSFFNAFMQAFVREFSQSRVIQIHGHAKEKRKTVEGQSKDIILSSGSKVPSGLLLQLEKDIRKEKGERLGIYPKDVKELGGTLNIQGKVLREMGLKNFIHVELSYELRQALLKSKKARSQLFKNFIESKHAN